MPKTTRSAAIAIVLMLLVIAAVAFLVIRKPARPPAGQAATPPAAATTRDASADDRVATVPATTTLAEAQAPPPAVVAPPPPPPANEDGLALLPSVTPPPPPAPAPAAAGDIATFVRFAADGRLLVARPSGLIEIVDLVTDQRQRVDLKLPSPRAIAVSPGGGQVAVANEKSLEVWHAASGSRSTPDGHGGDVTALAFTGDGAALVTGHASGAVKVWDVRGWTVRTTLRPDVGAVARVAVAPAGQHLAVVGTGVAVYAAGGGQPRATLAAGQAVSDAAFAPDGLTLATADAGGVTLWDTILWQKRPSPASGSAVSHVAFWGGAPLLVTAGGDGVVRAWDLATRRHVMMLSGATPPLASIALSDDGRTAAACDAAGVIVWNVDTRAPRRLK